MDFERHELGRFNNALGSGRLRSVKLWDRFQSERQVGDLSTATFADQVKAHRVASRRQVAERANKAVDHKPQTIDGPGSTKQSTATKKFFVKESKLFKRLRRQDIVQHKQPNREELRSQRLRKLKETRKKRCREGKERRCRRRQTRKETEQPDDEEEEGRQRDMEWRHA